MLVLAHRPIGLIPATQGETLRRI